MKKRVALAMAMVLALPVALTACKCKKHVDKNWDAVCDKCGETISYENTYLGFEGMFNSSYQEEDYTIRKYGQATRSYRLENLSMQQPEYSDAKLIAFSNSSAVEGATKYAVLNTTTGEVVFSLTKEYYTSTMTSSATIYTEGENSFILKREKTDGGKYTQTIYNEFGREILSKTTNSSSYIDVYQVYKNDYVIDGKVYEVVNGECTYKFDAGLKEFPEVDYASESYYYDISSNTVYVYDLEYNLVNHYALLNDATNARFYVLSNGNVFVQYYKALPEHAESYDIYMNGMKYDLRSQIYNVTDDTVKELDLNYIVQGMGNKVTEPEMFEGFVLSEKIVNVVAVNYIVDKAIDTRNTKCFSMSDDMRMLGVLGQEVANQEGIAEAICQDRILVEDKAGNEYLINSQGALVGNVTNAYYDGYSGYFVSYDDSKYYDIDLNLVFDVDSIEYTRYTNGSSKYYTVYYKTTETGASASYTSYYVRKGITVTSLSIPSSATNLSLYDNYIKYTDYDSYTGNHYTVYANYQGDVIYKGTSGASVNAFSYGDLLILQVSEYDSYNYSYTTNYYIAK